MGREKIDRTKHEMKGDLFCRVGEVGGCVLCMGGEKGNLEKPSGGGARAGTQNINKTEAGRDKKKVVWERIISGVQQGL